MAKRTLTPSGRLTLFALLVSGVAGCGPTPGQDASTKPEMVWATLKIMTAEPTIWPAPQNKADLAEFKSYMSNVLAGIKSDLVIERALDDKAVQNVPSIKSAGINAGAWLADQLVVRNLEESEYVQIGLPDDADDDVYIIVNAVANAFLDEAVNKQRTERLNRRDQLEKKLDAYKAELSAKRTALHEMSDRIEGPNLAIQANLSISKAQWSKASEQATAAELELAHAKANLSHLQAKDPSYDAAKNAVNSAMIDVEFWTKEISSAKAETAALAAELKSDPNLDLLSDEVRQLQNVANEISESLTQMNINLDAPPRIVKLCDAQHLRTR